MNWTKEDIDKVEKFIEIKNKGYYADGTQLTEVYNRVLGKNVNVTNCGSCLRGRVQELEDALRRFKEICKRQEEIKAQEEQKQEQVDNIPQTENNATGEVKKRVGRPKKE